MQVWINGTAHELGDGAVRARRARRARVPGSGVAVAVDGEVVPRAEWAATALADGARVEVLTAVQGG